MTHLIVLLNRYTYFKVFPNFNSAEKLDFSNLFKNSYFSTVDVIISTLSGLPCSPIDDAKHHR